jgi:hypothetical protein
MALLAFLVEGFFTVNNDDEGVSRVDKIYSPADQRALVDMLLRQVHAVLVPLPQRCWHSAPEVLGVVRAAAAGLLQLDDQLADLAARGHRRGDGVCRVRQRALPSAGYALSDPGAEGVWCRRP